MSTSYEELEQKVANEGMFEEKTPQELTNQFLGVNVIPYGAVSIDFSEKLGEGAYGSVYKGSWMGREVALKQINSNSLGMKKRLQEIYGATLQEARIQEKTDEIIQWEILRASTLSHPNIVQFYGVYIGENVDTKKNTVYQVMELCGKPLQLVLEKKPNFFEFRPSLRWQWALEIAQGLAYLHKQGVLYRDLKADNILVAKDNQIRLADFGLAQVDALIQFKESPPVRAGNQNSSFMAPELVRYHFKLFFQEKVPLALTAEHAPALVCIAKEEFYIISNDGLGSIQENPVVPKEDAKSLELEVFFQQYYSKKPVFLAGTNKIMCYVREKYKQIDIKTLSSKEADIYALGLLFWQLVTCETPQRLLVDRGQGQPKEYNQKILDKMQTGLREDIPDDCPPGFKEIIESCWQLDPCQRPTAEKIVQTLNDLGAKFHTKSEWIKLCGNIDTLIHPARAEMLKYIEPYVTEKPIIEDLDAYWRRIENTRYLNQESKKREEEIKINNENTLIENPPLKLSSTLEDFLRDSSASVLILLGDAGLGKTLSTYQFAHQCLSECWQFLTKLQREGVEPYYPLLIRLILDNWSHGELKGALEKAFNHLQFFLKGEGCQRARWLVIIDGYDECQGADSEAINVAQQLGLENFPNAKLLVTCRADTVKNSKLYDRFALKGKLAIKYFLPFNVDQIFHYLEKKLYWKEDIQVQYRQKFQNIPALQAALCNPFVLSLLVKSWEVISKKDFNQLNRWKIYEGFVEYWVNTVKFLLPETLVNELWGKPENVLKSFNTFAAGIAFEGFQKKTFFLDTENTSPDLRALHDLWCNLEERVLKDAEQKFAVREKTLTEAERRRVVLNKEDYTKIMLLRLQQFKAGSPLKIKNNKFFEVTHKSFFEYFSAKRIVELREQDPKFIIEKGLMLLNRRPIQEEPEILHFVSEAWQEPETQLLKKPLFKIIKHSKSERLPGDIKKEVVQASANAATLLNACKVPFSGKNLSFVRIWGADLTYAILDNTNFEGADLTRVTLFGVWLHNINFKNAVLKDVLFDEHPPLFLDISVSMCCYSPNGQILAVAGDNIQLFDPLTRALKHRLSNVPNVPDFITCISFSNDSHHLASGSRDGVVKLWEVDTGRCVKRFEGHTDCIQSISFSPDGQFIASGSAGYNEKSDLKIWTINTGTSRTFEGKRLGSLSACHVSFSPDGQLLAEANPYCIRLWNMATRISQGKICKGLKSNISFSHGGQIIAIGCNSTRASPVPIKLFDVKTGAELNALKGHTSFINSISFHPAKPLLVSASHDGTVKLWDTATGVCLKTLLSSVTSVNFSPDGKRVVFGNSDKSVRFWDLGNLTYKQQMLEGFITCSTSINCSDGIHVAMGKANNTVQLWNATWGGCIKTLNGHTDPIQSLNFSPNGQRIASGNHKNREVKLWDVSTGECLKTLNSPVDDVIFNSSEQLVTLGRCTVAEVSFWDVRDDIPLSVNSWGAAEDPSYWKVGGSGALSQIWEWHTETVDQICVSPDEEFFASYDKTYGRITLWEVATDNFPRMLEGQIYGMKSFCFSPSYYSPDRQLLAAVGVDQIRLWDVKTGSVVKEIKSSVPIFCIGFSTYSLRYKKPLALESKNGEVELREEPFLAVGDGEGRLKLWSAITGTSLMKLKSYDYYINSISISTQKPLIASTGGKPTIKVWDINQRECIMTLEAPCIQNYVSFNSYGSRLVSGGNSGGILLWNITTGTRLKTLVNSGDQVLSVIFSPDEQLIASATAKSVKLFDTTTGECLREIDGSYEVTFTFDGMLITTGRTLGVYAKLWDVDTNTCLKTLKWSGQEVKSVISSSDGKFFVSVSQEPSDDSRSFVTGEYLKTFEGSGPCLRFSPGERFVASGGGGRGSMKLWNANGEYLRTLTGHVEEVNKISISSDGELIASASDDKTVRLWNSSTGSCLKELKGHASMDNVSLSPDKQYLAASSKDNTLWLWNLKNLNSGKNNCYMINLINSINSLSFAQRSGDTSLISTDNCGHIHHWQVASLNSKPFLQLHHSNARVLWAPHANIDNAELSREDAVLLKERGAEGEPILTQYK